MKYLKCMLMLILVSALFTVFSPGTAQAAGKPSVNKVVVQFSAYGHRPNANSPRFTIPANARGNIDTWGKSERSGCHRVTLDNGDKVNGRVVTHFITYMDYCTHRRERIVNGIHTGWYQRHTDFFSLDKVYPQQRRFYYWIPGARRSGYIFFQQARWNNCVPKLGCLNKHLSSNQLTVHSNGTGSVRTDDYARP